MPLPKIAVTDLTADDIESFSTGQAVVIAASKCNLSAASLNELAEGLTAQTAQINANVLENIIRYSTILRNMPELKTTLTALLTQHEAVEEYKVQGHAPTNL